MNNSNPYISFILDRKQFKEIQNIFVKTLKTNFNVLLKEEDLSYLERVSKYPLVSIAKNFSNRISLSRSLKVVQKSFLETSFPNELFVKGVTVKLGNDNSLYLGLELKTTEFSNFLFKNVYKNYDNPPSEHKLFVVFVKLSNFSNEIKEAINLNDLILNNLAVDYLTPWGIKVKGFNQHKKFMEVYVVLNVSKKVEINNFK
jgi:hypothetical protein